MDIRRSLGLLALPLVLLAALGVLFATGALRFGAAPADAHFAGDGHDHGAEHDDEDGHDHSAHAGGDDGEVPLDRLGSVACDHGVPAVDCGGCRFEVGVVKLEPEVEKALIRGGTAERREVVRPLRLNGRVETDRSRVVDVASPAPGRILSVEVDLGAAVMTGDLLAVIRSGEFGQAKASFLEALAAAEVAREESGRSAAVATALEELVSGLAARAESPGEGRALPAGGPVGEWRGKLVGAASRLRMLRLRHERETELEARGISARAEREEARQEMETAEAEYEALLEEVRLSLGIDRLKADHARKLAEVSLLAAEQALKVFGLAPDEIADLRAGKLPEEFSRLEIRAPRDGVVTARAASVGRTVTPEESLFTVAGLSTLWVWCDLYERDLPEVVEALSETGPLPAHVRAAVARGASIEGTLDLLGSEVDPRTRTVKARVVVSAHDGRLRPGMFVSVTVEIPAGRQALLVPRDAVLTDEGQSFVFFRWRGDLWVRRAVEVRDGGGDRVEVTGEIPEGAVVAAGGAFVLKSDVLREKMGAG
ncbi:MAG: efflux RND transporter periplasmic adaptor subunit [Planctomycetes bacterium]|nr:efflux RND transporter periplasmic adaptor subunit [Planctomycetota bacterium]